MWNFDSCLTAFYEVCHHLLSIPQDQFNCSPLASLGQDDIQYNLIKTGSASQTPSSAFLYVFLNFSFPCLAEKKSGMQNLNASEIIFLQGDRGEKNHHHNLLLFLYLIISYFWRQVRMLEETWDKNYKRLWINYCWKWFSLGCTHFVALSTIYWIMTSVKQ